MIRNIFRTILVFMLAGSGALAQDSPALDAVKQAAGRIMRFTLDNGMICLVSEDRSAPMVSIQIWVGTGSVHENEYLGAGLSHAIEHMIFKGTPSRKPGDITRTIDDAGGFINAYTSFDRTVFLVDMPSDRWLTGLEVLADAAMNAGFPEGEWEQEREVIMREMAMCRDNPDRELSRLLWQTAYTIHPHRIPVIGYEDVFRTITREDLVAFFKRNYTPDNMIVSVAGDISSAEAEKALRDAFSKFSRRARAPAVLPVEPDQIAPRLDRASGPYDISRIAMAWHTVALDHPDAAALDMLAAIAGQGRSSRLEQRIKEDKQLAFTIDAYSFTPKDPGLFIISATLAPDKEVDLIEAMKAEIEEWKTSLFSQQEIEKARRKMLAATLSELQTMGGQAGSYASGEFYARDPSFSLAYLSRLEAVTPEAIQEAALRYLRAENSTVIVLAPKTAPAPAVEIQPAILTAEVRKIVLGNGVTLLIKEDHRLPFVSFCAAFTGGLVLENEMNNGITRLMAETMTRGTTHRSSREIADAIESRGGSLAAFSGQDSFGLTARCLAPDVDLFMEILADCILNPAFLPSEVAIQKAEQKAAIARQRESPIFIGMEGLKGNLFPNHPYRFSPEGTIDTVEAISAEDLRGFHRKTVVSGNLVVSIFGDIAAGDAQKLAERRLKNIAAGMRPALECPLIAPKLPAESEQRAPREQTIVIAGFPGIGILDSRSDALAVLQNAMSGLSSGLMLAIREERGLAYFAGALNRTGLEPGFFAIYTGTREDATDEVRDLISGEIARLAGEGIRVDEFDRAVQQIISVHKQRSQDNSEMARECALNELFGLGYGHSYAIEQRMKELTPAAVTSAAESVLKEDRKAISIVLPEAGSREELVKEEISP